MKLPADVEAKVLAAARTPPPARPDPVGLPPPKVRVVVEVPGLVTVSEANAGGKLRAAVKRKTAVKAAVLAALPRLVIPLGLPVVVRLTRVGTGHRPLDDDNLRRALKSVRDVVAGWLQVDDADPRVKFRYAERRGYSPAVVIDVRPAAVGFRRPEEGP